MNSQHSNLHFPLNSLQLGSFNRRLWQRCLIGGTGLLSHLSRSYGDGLGILTNHRVSDSIRYDPTMLNVTPARFHKQLAGLLRLGYQPYQLSTLVQRHIAGEPFPRRAFVVVFDDGYEDIFVHARQVLSNLQVPATAFLATAYLDSPDPFPFADWPGDNSSRPLSDNQCRQLVDDVFVHLGSHTHTPHAFLERPRDSSLDLQ